MDVLEVGGAKQMPNTDTVVVFTSYKEQAISSFLYLVIQTLTLSYSSHLKLMKGKFQSRFGDFLQL